MLGIASAVLLGNLASADTVRPPLEKQFFDYFQGRCASGMAAEVADAGGDTKKAEAEQAIALYCACTAQAVVSFLSAEEILSFANDPEAEPAAGKMRPYFRSCQKRLSE